MVHKWVKSLISYLTFGVLFCSRSLSTALPTFGQTLENQPGLAISSPADPINFYQISNPATGLTRFLAGPKDSPRIHINGILPEDPPESASWIYLSEYGEYFGINQPISQLQLIRALSIGEANKKTNPRTYLRYQQVQDGVPVFGGELIVQLDGNNSLLSISGKTIQIVELITPPQVNEDKAVEDAVLIVSKHYQQPEHSLRTTEPSLWIYNPSIFGTQSITGDCLVWRIEVTSLIRPDLRVLVLINAANGRLELSFNQTHTIRSRIVYDNNNTPNIALPGNGPARLEGQGPTGNINVDRAYDNAGMTYDYYYNNFSRDSIDGNGMPIVSTVRYCPEYCPFDNAFWNGAQMVYGTGFALADDVVGHELTHGVTEHESSLFYYMQSGAINEALSDIFGEFIDQTYNTTYDDDSDGVKWLMGEDIGAIRSMSNPPAFGDPDKTSSANYYCGSNDGGGVHTNSGVANKAAFLMVDGGTFNSHTINGIGLVKSALIWYEVQTNLLTSASDYADLGLALSQACNTLVGENGITTNDCDQVNEAAAAVEMHLQPEYCAAPEAPLCDVIESSTGYPLTNYYDDLENPVSGSWIKHSLIGSNGWYYPQSSNPFGYDARYGQGAYNLWGYDQPYIADSAIEMKRFVSLPDDRTSYVHFMTAFDFEATYDGGVIEYQTSEAGPWIDAGSLVTENGYTGVISNLFGNPLRGRNAYVNDSEGMVSVRMDLDTLRGQQFRLRWRIGTDDGIDDEGWFIDNLRVYTCEAAHSQVFLPMVNTSRAITQFHSNFNGSSSGWEFHSGGWSVDPAYLRSSGLPAAWSSASYSKKEFGNGTTEVRILRNSCEWCSNAVFIRGIPAPFTSDNLWHAFYAFEYTNDGRIRVLKREPGGVIDVLLNWTATPAINIGTLDGDDWNILRVTADGSALSFYINEVHVWSGTDSALASGRIGVAQYGTTGWNPLTVDWVSYTK